MGDVLSPAEIQYEQTHASDSQQTLVRAVVAVATAVGWSAIVLRIIARRRARAKLGWDDYTAFMGVALGTCCSAFALMMVQYGLGRHVIFVASKQDFITAVLTTEVLYVASLPFLKMSLLCLYTRLFPSRRLRLATRGVGGFVVAYSIVLAVCIVVQCVPIASFWTGEPAHCIDFAVVLVVCSVCNIATDIVIIALPVPFVWNLKASRAKRLQLLATFVLGGLVTIISIVRTVLVARPSSADKSWSDVGATIVSVVEVHIGVLCACLPTLRPLLRPSTRRAGYTDYADYASSNPHPSQSAGPGRDAAHKSWFALDDLEDGSRRATPEAGHRGPPEPPPPSRAPGEPSGIRVDTNIEIANESEPEPEPRGGHRPTTRVMSPPPAQRR